MNPEETATMESNPKRILIVEDSKDTRDVYEAWLSMKGFSVITAGDGQEGLDKALQLQPDLVIMDLSLPVISGWEATRRLKADARTRHIPVLILTGHELFSATEELGSEGFLIKPCLPDTIVAEIRRILGNQANQASYDRTEDREPSVDAEAAGTK